MRNANPLTNRQGDDLGKGIITELNILKEKLDLLGYTLEIPNGKYFIDKVRKETLKEIIKDIERLPEYKFNLAYGEYIGLLKDDVLRIIK